MRNNNPCMFNTLVFTYLNIKLTLQSTIGIAMLLHIHCVVLLLTILLGLQGE